MASTTMIHVRINEQVKESNFGTFGHGPVHIRRRVRVLLRVVAEKQMPFALKVSNAKTRAAMVEADEIVRTKQKVP